MEKWIVKVICDDQTITQKTIKCSLMDLYNIIECDLDIGRRAIIEIKRDFDSDTIIKYSDVDN